MGLVKLEQLNKFLKDLCTPAHHISQLVQQAILTEPVALSGQLLARVCKISYFLYSYA